MTKVLVIGLDGGSWNILRSLIKKRELHAIAKLMRDGSWGELESSIPPITFPAWKCYSTGKNPGKLGVYWFLGVNTEEQKIEVNNSTSFKSKEIWDYLGEKDISCGVLNMPTTYPPKKINGFMISRGAVDYSNYTYPKKLGEILRKKTGYKFTTQCSHEFDTDRYISEVKKLIKQRFEAAKLLLKKFNPDFLHMTIFYTDSIQHFFWRYMEEKHPNYGKAIEDVWKLIDREIAHILPKDEKSYIILMSDHGFTSVKCIFQIVPWLIEKGYLRLRRHKFSSKSILNKLELSLSDISPLVRKSKLFPLLRTLLPLKFQKKLYDFFPRGENVIERNPLEGLIDWKHSRVIPIPQGLLYLNPKMFNSRGEYKVFKNKLVGELKGIKDPLSEEYLAKEVYKTEELYSGPFVGCPPEIVILPTEGYEIACSANVSEKWIRSRRRWSGTHKLHGIFLIKGPNIRRGLRIQNVKILDLAPTILHIFGLPIPQDVDGKVLKTIFEPWSELAKRKIVYQKEKEKTKKEETATYSHNEEEIVKERLRKLGYL